MIIAFYPGGCGNRYLRYLQNKEYQTLQTSYDKFIMQKEEHRFLLNSGQIKTDNSTIILTHCLNIDKIKYHFPFENKIIAIKTDYKRSLKRQWMLDGVNLYLKKKTNYNRLDIYNSIKQTTWPIISEEKDLVLLTNDIKSELDKAIDVHDYYSGSTFVGISSAFESIKYHHLYYKQFPTTIFESEEVKIIDCEFSGTDFAKLVSKELSLYESSVYDFAWDTFYKYGIDAPILTMYEEFLKKDSI